MWRRGFPAAAPQRSIDHRTHRLHVICIADGRFSRYERPEWGGASVAVGSSPAIALGYAAVGSRRPHAAALRSALSATPAGTALGSQQVVRSEFVAMSQRVGALPAPGAGAADLEGFLPIRYSTAWVRAQANEP